MISERIFDFSEISGHSFVPVTKDNSLHAIDLVMVIDDNGRNYANQVVQSLFYINQRNDDYYYVQVLNIPLSKSRF